MTILTDIRTDFDLTDELFSDFEAASKEVFMMEDMDFDFEISLSFCSEDEIRALNRDFRGKDSVTDVLSFPLYEEDEDAESMDDEESPLGDVVICVPRAYAQAKEFGHSVRRELVFLYVHSLLHLLGYDHEEPEEAEEMESKQRIIMDRLGIGRE